MLSFHPTPISPPRTLVFSNHLPITTASTGGAKYISDLAKVLPADSWFVVLDNPKNRKLAEANSQQQNLIFIGSNSAKLPIRWFWKVAGRSQALIAARYPALRNWLWLSYFQYSPTARNLIKNADFIDLQWQQNIQLAPIFRKLNPKVRLVGTFHDLLSDIYQKKAAISPTKRKWRRAAWVSRNQISNDCQSLDRCFTLTERDQAELTKLGVNATVINPPIASGLTQLTSPKKLAKAPKITFVADFTRDVNQEAAVWFKQNCWPSLRQDFPDLAWQLAGNASDAFRSAWDKDAAITATGFVSDLGQMYTESWVCLVPLQQGSGVKFKTLEAICAGVPIVSTTIGLEGISSQLIPAATDSASEFTAAVRDKIININTAAEVAADRQQLALQLYSFEQFQQQIRNQYFGDPVA